MHQNLQKVTTEDEPKYKQKEIKEKRNIQQGKRCKQINSLYDMPLKKGKQ